MGDIKRHTQLDTTDYGAASILPANLYEQLEHGTVVASSRGSYLVFDTTFGGTPTMVVAGVNAAGTVPQLAYAPTSGSVLVNLSATGTVVTHYVVWGAR